MYEREVYVRRESAAILIKVPTANEIYEQYANSQCS